MLNAPAIKPCVDPRGNLVAEEIDIGNGLKSRAIRKRKGIPMLHRLAAKHLPYPESLRAAIAKRQVAVAFAPDGTVAYILSPACTNLLEVREAIDLRKRWELRVAVGEGALLGVSAVAAAALLMKLTSN